MKSRTLLGPVVALAFLAPPLARASDHEVGGHAHSHKSAKAADGTQVVRLAVTKEGFEPATVTVKKGTPVKLVVTRSVERTCATEIVMKDLGVNQPLPYGKEVAVVVTPTRAGDYKFSCAMDMIGGTLRVE